MPDNEVKERMIALEDHFLSLPHGELNNAVQTADLNITEIATHGSIQLIRICIERILRGDFNGLSHYAKGRVFLFKGDLAEAQKAFEDSLKEDFKVINSRTNLGATLMKLGEVKAAIEQWEIAESMGCVFAGMNIFSAYVGLKEPEKAMEQLEKVAAKGEEGLDIIFGYAVQHFQVHDDKFVWFLIGFLAEKDYVPALEWMLQSYEYHGFSTKFEKIMEQARRLGYSGFENGKLIGET